MQTIYKTIKKNQNNTRGFSLVETLVAISIFTISVLIMLVILSQGLSSVIYSQKKTIAAYLAQEGIEYARNMRDTYVLYSGARPSGWNSFKSSLGQCRGSNGCYFDTDNLFSLPTPMPITRITINGCGGSGCPTLLYNSSTGKYGYNSGASSGFLRQIKVNNVGGPGDEENIISTVYWVQDGNTYSITLQENLYNWLE